MTEQQRSPIDAALDLVLYAPLGLALTAREELPQLIDKGRQRVSSQVTMAKMIGQFAVNQGGQEAGKLLKQATGALVGLGVLPGGPARPPARPDQPGGGDPGLARSSAGESHGTGPGGNGRAPGAPPPPRADAEAIGIPGYDSLSASQVVQRLAGLTDGELAAVQSYEAATRGRRTILARVAQLQADRS